MLDNVTCFSFLSIVLANSSMLKVLFVIDRIASTPVVGVYWDSFIDAITVVCYCLVFGFTL